MSFHLSFFVFPFTLVSVLLLDFYGCSDEAFDLVLYMLIFVAGLLVGEWLM